MAKFYLQEVGASPFIPGFTLFDAHLENGIVIRFARAGQGRPLLMVHGHPHNHVIWRKVAPRLAEHYTVILPDLRGYGDSSKPASDAEHTPYSKRRACRTPVCIGLPGVVCNGNISGYRADGRNVRANEHGVCPSLFLVVFSYSARTASGKDDFS